MAKTKKIDPKAVAKNEVMVAVQTALENLGFKVLDGTDFGMTKGTVVVRLDNVDVQLKPIAPKAGVDRYEEEVEETA